MAALVVSSPWTDVPTAKAAGSATIDYAATLSGSNYFTATDAAAFDVTGNMGNAGGETAKMTSLSQKRAMAARSLLRDRGVTGVIAIQSYGATQTVSNSKKDSQQALNRRAEIYVIP